MKYQEYTNTEILDKVNQILKNDEYKNYCLTHVLKVKDECQNCYAVAMNGDKIIGFNPFEDEIDILPEWDFNIDTEIFEELEWNREIIYMSIECHYSIWNEVSSYYPIDIEHIDGMQEYLKYCKQNGISKEYIDEKIQYKIPGANTPDIMKLFKEKIKLDVKLVGIDNWDRPVYKDVKGNIYKDVSLGIGALSLCTSSNNDFYGEPNVPLNDNYQINIVKDFNKKKNRNER